MLNVLKSFLAIVVSCFGIGFSISLPQFINLFLVAVFVVLDLIGVYFVLKYSKSDLLGSFYTFFPSLTFTEMINSDGLLMGLSAKTVLLALECSFILVLIGLLIYSAVLCLKRITKNWGWVFSSSFFIL